MLCGVEHACNVCRNALIMLPRRLNGKEFACQCKRHGLSLWSGNVPHALEQLSPYATATEPVLQIPGTTTSKPMTATMEALEPML